MDSEKRSDRIRDRRAIYIVAPFVLLSLCLLAINLFSLKGSESAEGLAGSPLPTVTLTTSSTLTRPALAETVGPTATFPASTPTPKSEPSPTVSPTLEPLPTYPSDVEIQLLGPPSDSVFDLDDKIVFYWQWAMPLEADEHFGLFLLHENEEILLGEIDEPNLGSAYRLSAAMEDYLEVGADASWQVRLLSKRAPLPRVVSESRPMRFVSGR